MMLLYSNVSSSLARPEFCFDRQGVEIPNIKIIGYLDKRDFITVLDAILL